MLIGHVSRPTVSAPVRRSTRWRSRTAGIVSRTVGHHQREHLAHQRNRCGAEQGGRGPGKRLPDGQHRERARHLVGVDAVQDRAGHLGLHAGGPHDTPEGHGGPGHREPRCDGGHGQSSRDGQRLRREPEQLDRPGPQRFPRPQPHGEQPAGHHADAADGADHPEVDPCPETSEVATSGVVGPKDVTMSTMKTTMTLHIHVRDQNSRHPSTRSSPRALPQHGGEGAPVSLVCASPHQHSPGNAPCLDAVGGGHQP